MRENYFDHAATTPLDPRVLQEMLPWLAEDWGNAHSLHHWGRKAMAGVERAREALAELLDAGDPGEIVFTSGATEANNWALSQGGSLALSPFEHPSVREPALARGGVEAEAEGWSLLAPDGLYDVLSVMLVNNETGALVDAAAWHQASGRLSVTGRGAKVFHRDLTQAAGKMPLHEHGYDWGSLSAHKFYGPKGVGALHLRGASLDSPLLMGGGQELGARAGTLNVPGIVGMGAAARIALDEMEANWAHAEALRAIVLEELEGLSGWRAVEGPPGPRGEVGQSPYILSCLFDGVEGETLVIELDAVGFAVSSGAACSSGSTEPSHVLLALGIPQETIRGALRFSFGPENSKESARELGRFAKKSVENVRHLG